LFAFPRVMGLFLRSEAPGLVFAVTYPWGSFQVVLARVGKLRELNFESVVFSQRLYNPNALGDDLLADTIPWNNRDLKFFHRYPVV